jgi:prolyl oligopeptidase
MIAKSPGGCQPLPNWQQCDLVAGSNTMTRSRICSIICLLLLVNAVHADPAGDFQALLDDEWDWQLRENPVRASRLGDRRWNDQWADRSLDAIERRQEERQDFLRRLRLIDSGKLNETDRLNYELFRRRLENALDAYPFRDYLMPVNQMEGVQTLDSTADSLRLESSSDYEDWLARMSQVETVIDQTMALMEEGRREGYMPPKVLMERVPAQIESQLVEDPTQSPFYKVFATMPEGIPEADRERLQQLARELIDESVVPAYREFHRYFTDTYLPASRDTIAASALPNGEAFYEYRARLYTTTSMTPDEIHRLGLNEVKRIRDEMQLVIDELEFKGSFDDFLNFLRTDPQFYYRTPEALFDGYLAVAKRIDPQLVRLFGKLPRMPYGLRPIPDNIAPDTTTAYYNRPAADGSRAGYYYVNLYRPEVRPKYEMEVLTIHEAVPGHHLQIALQMELEAMPNFRKYNGFTAFTEGWGLYSESLGYEMGFYSDPYSHFGALTYDMWRAVRLVVDTGMHYKGWTRQQAIDFFKANAAKTEQDIVNEIDRYIAWPGQALAYKIGQLKMLELRRKAESALGKDFDVRAFHDALLGGGALPMEILETRMNHWLAEALAAKASSPRQEEQPGQSG